MVCVVPKDGWFLLLCSVLYLSGIILCDNGQDRTPPSFEAISSSQLPSDSPSLSSEVCEITPDYSSTEGELRTAIFAANTTRAAEILSRNETFGLGAGLRYRPEQRCALVRTKNRRRDPDIVAYQAIAMSARDTGQAEKLADAIILSLELECRCSLFNSTERDRMRDAFREILRNLTIVNYILAYGGSENEAKVSRGRRRRRKSHGRLKRRLQQGSDSDTEVCALCEPPKACDCIVNWCPRNRLDNPDVCP